MNTHSIEAILGAAARAGMAHNNGAGGEILLCTNAQQLRRFSLEISSMEGLHHALLNPGPVERDEQGYWWNDALPATDENVDHVALLKAFRLELGYVDAENQMDDAAYEAMCEAGGSIAEWQPQPPAGEGWIPLSIHDTEDGPVAWYVRPIPPRRELTRKERAAHQSTIDDIMGQASEYAEAVANAHGMKDKVAAHGAIETNKARLRVLVAELVKDLIDAKAVQQ